jgi:hypothetical protein
MKTLSTIFAVLLLAVTAMGQTTKTLTLNGDGTVLKPETFWDLNAQGIREAQERSTPYAVFVIPLPPGSTWTDFELKASTANFAAGDPEMVYWYHSPDPKNEAVPGQVWTNRPDVYFTDSGRTTPLDARAWVKQNAEDSIYEMLASPTSEVGGFVIVVKDDLSAQRAQLVWSYSLIAGGTPDRDTSNRVIWRPIWPQQWTNSFTP